MPILGLVMGMVGCAVALLVGIMIFSSISESIDCDNLNNIATQVRCNEVKNISWTVIGLIPIALFFVLFIMFGAFGGESERETSYTEVITNSGKSVIGLLQHTFISLLLLIGLAKVEKGK